MRERGVTAVAMEVSSHALAMGRVDGCTFDVAGFTQLSIDHLDFHRTPEAYFAAKAMLFQADHSHTGVVTIDDDAGRRIAEQSDAAITTMGWRTEPQKPDWLIADKAEREGGGYTFALHGPDGAERACEVALMGSFNITNAALAQLMLEGVGVAPTVAARGISECRGVPGRMERVGPQDVALVVDYAHTTDALGRAIEAVRPSSGRVIVVFGCGGDRDPTKRAPMGEVAARTADVVIITDDNPRSEEPARIRQSVLEGTQQVAEWERAHTLVIGSRRLAIERAVSEATPGDVVLVAGKGHEPGQEAQGVIAPFDDRIELRDAWERLHPYAGEGTS
jgi:UDP-N-acetylmuramoyl-L-alanyl-D-glutamate--2,6-diaminopimelate ligase